MGGKKSTPKAPDFTALAEQTAQSSKEATTAQTYANRANQHSPGGDSTWEASSFIDPATGQKVTSWDQYIKLSPESQRAFDAQLAVNTRKPD